MKITFVRDEFVNPPSAISNPLYFHPGAHRKSLAMQEHLAYRLAHTFPIPTNSHPTALAINPEGTFIAVGCVSGDIFIWCLSTRDLVCRGSPPTCICGECAATITTMTWLEGGVLFSARCNGLMGVIRVGKVCWKPSHRGASQGFLQRSIDGTCVVAHAHLPIHDMVYSKVNGLWAVATHNEVAFIQWKPNNCGYPVTGQSLILS